MKIKALLPWFGSKRTLAPEIAIELGQHQAFWEPFCFPPGTPVRTENGWSPIESLTPGKLVLTKDGFSPVGRVMANPYVGELVSVAIRGDYRPLACTPNHPLLCVRKESLVTVKQSWWKESHKNPPEFVPFPRTVGAPATARGLSMQRARALEAMAEWVRADEIRPGDLLLYHFDPGTIRIQSFPLPTVRYGGRVRNRKTHASVDSRLARLIGLYLAEGCCDDHSVLFTFNQSERSLIDFVTQEMHRVFDAKANVKVRPGTRTAQVKFGSTQAVRFFGEFGKGATRKHIPSPWNLLGERLSGQLIRGLFEGDGYRSEDGPNLDTASYELATNLFDILVRLGCLPTITVDNRPRKLPCGRLHHGTYFRVAVYGEGRQRIGRLLGREYRRSVQRKVGANLWGCGASAKTRRPILIRRVLAVTRFPFNGQVHNLTVAGNPSFVTPQGTVHNCGSMAVLFAKEPCGHEYVNDLYGDLTNLAHVLASDRWAELQERLRRTLCSEEFFATAKRKCHLQAFDPGQLDDLPTAGHVDRAYWFFIYSWLGMNGFVGSTANTSYSIRFTTTGGSQSRRFLSSIDSMGEWHERLRLVAITNRDGLELIEKIDDSPEVAIYADPPYLLPTRAKGGNRYVHEFAPEAHERLASLLARFGRARVVVSYYDSPDLDRLYPGWTVRRFMLNKQMSLHTHRGSKVKQAPEVLLINGPSYACEEGELF